MTIRVFFSRHFWRKIQLCDLFLIGTLGPDSLERHVQKNSWEPRHPHLVVSYFWMLWATQAEGWDEAEAPMWKQKTSPSHQDITKQGVSENGGCYSPNGHSNGDDDDDDVDDDDDEAKDIGVPMFRDKNISNPFEEDCLQLSSCIGIRHLDRCSTLNDANY